MADGNEAQDAYYDANLENWFTHHPPRNDLQVIAYQKIRSSGRHLAAGIMNHCPPGHERNIALDKIREAVMWANAGIACGEPE